MARRAARVDSNHAELVAYFRANGCEVESLAPLGRGVADLLVGWKERIALVEVKTQKGRLTPAQRRFRQRFPVRIAMNEQQAMGVVRYLKRNCIFIPEPFDWARGNA